MRKKDDLDKLVEKLSKRNPRFKEELKRAERAWDIALQIQILRNKRGLTQKDLAGLTKTSQAAIARLENAEYTGYTLSTLEKVAVALDARVDLVVVPKEQDDKYKDTRTKPLFSLP